MEASDVGPAFGVQWLSSAVLSCTSERLTLSVGRGSDTVPASGDVSERASEQFWL
jgi:hypothetical protein